MSPITLDFEEDECYIWEHDYHLCTLILSRADRIQSEYKKYILECEKYMKNYDNFIAQMISTAVSLQLDMNAKDEEIRKEKKEEDEKWFSWI